jgi:hypothetical protein
VVEPTLYTNRVCLAANAAEVPPTAVEEEPAAEGEGEAAGGEEEAAEGGEEEAGEVAGEPVAAEEAEEGGPLQEYVVEFNMVFNGYTMETFTDQEVEALKQATVDFVASSSVFGDSAADDEEEIEEVKHEEAGEKERGDEPGSEGGGAGDNDLYYGDLDGVSEKSGDLYAVMASLSPLMVTVSEPTAVTPTDEVVELATDEIEAIGGTVVGHAPAVPEGATVEHVSVDVDEQAANVATDASEHVSVSVGAVSIKTEPDTAASGDSIPVEPAVPSGLRGRQLRGRQLRVYPRDLKDGGVVVDVMIWLADKHLAEHRNEIASALETIPKAGAAGSTAGSTEDNEAIRFGSLFEKALEKRGFSRPHDSNPGADPTELASTVPLVIGDIALLSVDSAGELSRDVILRTRVDELSETDYDENDLHAGAIVMDPNTGTAAEGEEGWNNQYLRDDKFEGWRMHVFISFAGIVALGTVFYAYTSAQKLFNRDGGGHTTSLFGNRGSENMFSTNLGDNVVRDSDSTGAATTQSSMPAIAAL